MAFYGCPDNLFCTPVIIKEKKTKKKQKKKHQVSNSMIVALFSVSFFKLRVLRKYNNRPIININISMFN